MVKLIAFDLDGTVGDTIALCLQAFEKAVAPYTANGSLSEEEIVQHFGLNEEGMVKKIAGEKWEDALHDFYTHYEAMHSMCPAPFERIPELIQTLKSHHIVVPLITGKGEKSCRISLRCFHMEEVFSDIETGSPDRNRKAEAMTYLLTKYQLQADEMLYVGDTVSDITPCREAGIQCLSAGWATSTDIRPLEQYNPDYVFPTVQSLWDYLIDLCLYTNFSS